MVIAPANTGNDNNSKTAVIPTAQQNNGICSQSNVANCILYKVTIKLMAPAIEEIPAKCKLNIAMSTAEPA